MGWVILFVALVTIGVLATVRWFRVNIFQSNAKVGDHCIFYIENDRYTGRIIAEDSSSVVIEYMEGSYQRNRTDIYPL